MPETAYRTIITPQEVLYHTPRQQGTDVNNIRHMLPLKEEALFNVWLGLDWHTALLDDLIDHGSPAYFVEGSNYNTGEVLEWRDKLYRVTGTPDSAGALPSDEANWEEAPKFTNADNEYLWKRYLRTVLAWYVMHTGLVYQAMQQSALGIVQAGVSDKQQPVRGRDLSSFKTEVGEDANSFLQTMHAYLLRNKTKFPLYKGNAEATDCNGTTQPEIGYQSPYYGFTF